MVVIQNLLIPYVVGMATQDLGVGGMSDPAMESSSQLTAVTQKVEISFNSLLDFVGTMADWFVSLRGVFLMLSLIQGLFAGLVLGKLSEGDMSSGMKHSLIMMTIGFFVISLAQGALAY